MRISNPYRFILSRKFKLCISNLLIHLLHIMHFTDEDESIDSKYLQFKFFQLCIELYAYIYFRNYFILTTEKPIYTY